jgi:hypothetical protein
LRAIVPSHYVLDSWAALVRSIQVAPAAPQVPDPARSTTPPVESRLRECEHCRVSKGESWYHKDGICPSKPQAHSLVSDENLPKEAAPAGECAWCLKMLGKSFVHRSSCPNNVTIMTKQKGRFVDSLCVWCLQHGIRSVNHRYLMCRNKPPGTQHCPYCYRVCGVVEFHTIYECKNSPSLSGFDQGSASKRSPHVNELSLKDQIFHLELKIAKCRESILKAATRAEEKLLKVKLQNLFATEETLVNQLRLLEVKTLAKNGSVSSSSFPAPPIASTLPLPSSSSESLPSFDSSSAVPYNPDREKYHSLFGNGLLFGEMEEVTSDWSEGEGGAGYGGDPHTMDRQMGLGEEEEVESQPSPSSRKRKHVAQLSLPTAKQSRLEADEERG